MKEPAQYVRRGLYNVLNGNITYDGSNVSIYNTVPVNAYSNIFCDY
jgi:hypothetical protein